MLPTRKEAEALLAEAESCNPGPWVNHSRAIPIFALNNRLSPEDTNWTLTVLLNKA